MQRYNIDVQLKAQLDAERIDDYIRYILLNPKAADDLINCLEMSYKKIANNPHGFSIEWIANKAYRRALVKDYIVLFRIDEQTHTVHIVAIGHSLQKRKNIVKQ